MALAARKRLTLKLAQESVPLSAPFVITGYTFTEVQVIVARLDDGDAIARRRGSTSQPSARVVESARRHARIRYPRRRGAASAASGAAAPPALSYARAARCS